MVSDPLETQPPRSKTQISRDALQKPPSPLLQAYFDGEADLERELAARFPQMPLMSLFHLRPVGTRRQYGTALLSAQDGSAGMRVEVDPTRGVMFTFTLASMLGYSYAPARLHENDRTHWLETMTRQDGEPAFLWGGGRWETDYLVAIARPHFTHLYAFSGRTEAAVRLTGESTLKLANWLAGAWGFGRGRANGW